MKKIRSRKARAAIYAGIAVLSFAVLFFLLRGPYLSNFTKRLIIPTLENATRERIIMDKAVINLLPFYIQAKGVKVFDKDGNMLLWITKTRAYIDLSGLFVKEVRIRKFTMIEPRLTINRNELESVTQNVKEYMSRKKGKFKVALMNVDVTDGELALDDIEGRKSVSGKGLFFHVRVKDTISASLLLKEAMLKLPDTSAIKGSLEGKLEMENNLIKINDLNVRSAESNLKAEGEILLTPEGRLGQGSFKTTAEIYASTFHELFGLKQDKEGVLSFDGTVSLAPGRDSEWPGISVDLNTKSRFYLETLMEILEVRQDITGEVIVDGRITGTFPDITGSGKAELRDAVFDHLPIDNAVGDIAYENKKFTLNDFTAQTYGGKLEGHAHILIPGGNFSVTADGSGVSSPELFSFIKWDAPFPPGKISGNFQLDHKDGQKIAVAADLDYRNVSPREGNILNRIETMSTSLELREDILTLRDSVISSSRSDLYLDGSIDFDSKVMDLDLRLESSDIADLTAPYYRGLSSPARFAGKAKGPLKDPGITGDIEAGPGSVEGIMFTSAHSSLKYRISSLVVDSLRVLHGKSEYDASGMIEFRKAEGLFSFKAPFYRAKASVKDAELRPFIKAAYKDIPVSGLASGILSFEGDPAEFTGMGDLTMKEVDVYGQKADRVEVKGTLHPKSIEFRDVNAYRGNSRLDAKGTIFFNGKYNVSASSGKFYTGDIDITRDYPLSADISMDIKGSGTFADPDLEFSVNILESYLKNAKMGAGWIRGRYQGKKLTARADLINGQIAVNAAADLSDKMPWNADVKLKEGRYDFLVSGLLAEVPEDLMLNLEGGISLKGTGSSVSMKTRLTSAELFLYGYDFINDRDIDLVLDNDELMINSFAFTGDNADFSASGVMKIGQDYNVILKGKLDVAPLKILTARIESLKGHAKFAIEITGRWKEPEFLGEINLDNVTAKPAGFQYKIGPVNGSLYLNKNRLTFEDIDAGFANGRATMSGTGYLKGLSLERIYISSTLDSMRVRPMEKVSAAFDGRLFYERSSRGSILSGNIDIKKARYGKKVEFNKLMLGLNEIQKGGQDITELLGRTELNIRITGMEDILIDNNIAKTPVKISLNVMGSVDQKGLIGRVEADEGTIFFRGNEFKILEGSSVEFVSSNSISPVFHVLSETYVNDYYIRLTLDGTTDNFALSLYSDPPLSEMDILTLLTFGQVKRELRGFESGLAASEAASVLTGGLQEAVEDRFKNIADVERFEIEPHTTATGSLSPKVTVGKRVLEDKLYVIYSTSIGTTEEHIIKLKYSINKNIAIVGSRDEIGSAGMDLKYRFEFR